MSMPNIPNLNPTISINRDDTINLILSSIGMEELSLAHIVNAEAEKIQFALGTLETADGAASLEDIMNVNNSAKRMLRDVIKNQMLIGMKMEDTVDLATQAYAAAEPTKEEVVEAEEEVKAETAEKEAVAEEAPAEEEPVAEEAPADQQA